MLPNEILLNVRDISDMVKEMLVLNDLEELNSKRNEIIEKIELFSNIPDLKEYCISIRKLVDMFISDPFSRSSYEGSLLNLLSLNSLLRMEVIKKYSLCSEPDY